MSSPQSNSDSASRQRKPWSWKWKLFFLLSILIFLTGTHVGVIYVLIYYDYLGLGKKSIGHIEEVKSVATRIENWHQCPEIVPVEATSFVSTESLSNVSMDPKLKMSLSLPDSLDNISSERRLSGQARPTPIPSPKTAHRPKKG